MNKYNHPYHLVTLSPWPIMCSLSLMIFFIGIIEWFYEFNMNLFYTGLISLLLSISQWWRDVIRESTYQGFHTMEVMKLIKMGMILFIISEIFFFLSFFWTFFHASLSPNIDIGNKWPPSLILTFNPFNVPLLNTIVLLSSGISITWSHYNIINMNYMNSLKGMKLTIYLGLYFSYLQYTEYKESMFTISDSIYGSIFYLLTGFHGIHVIIGTIFNYITYKRLKKLQFSNKHHFGFEASAWYWHFVDVVWLLVYITLYWWSY